MSLYKKTLLLSGATILILVLSLYIILRSAVLNSFSQLEVDRTHADVQRALGAVASDLANLDKLVTDWAAWDATYAFVRGENDSYPDDNFAETSDTLDINAILIATCSNTVLYQRGFDQVTQHDSPLPAGFLAALALLIGLSPHTELDTAPHVLTDTAQLCPPDGLGLRQSAATTRRTICARVRATYSAGICNDEKPLPVGERAGNPWVNR